MSQDLKNLIKTQVPISMKSGDKFKTSVLRMILSEIQKLEIEEKCELNENQIISILEKMIKQRKDSITQFEQANRQELADKEKLEILCIKEFLPEQMSHEEIFELVSKVVLDLNAESMKDMGKIMGAIKKKYPDSIDFSKVNTIVKDLLN